MKESVKKNKALKLSRHFSTTSAMKKPKRNSSKSFTATSKPKRPFLRISVPKPNKYTEMLRKAKTQTVPLKKKKVITRKQPTESKATSSVSSPKGKRNSILGSKLKKEVPVTPSFYTCIDFNPTLHEGIKTYEKTIKTEANQLATVSSDCDKFAASTDTEPTKYTKHTTFIILSPCTLTAAEGNVMLVNGSASTNTRNTSSAGMPPANKNLQGGHEGTTLSTSESVEPYTAQQIDECYGSLIPRIKVEPSDEIVFKDIAGLSKGTSSSTPVSIPIEPFGQRSSLNNRKLTDHNAEFVTKSCAKLEKPKLQNKNLKNQHAPRSVRYSPRILLKNKGVETGADRSAKRKPSRKSLEGKQDVGKSAANKVTLVECPKNTVSSPSCSLITTSENHLIAKKIESESNVLSSSSTGMQPAGENLLNGQPLQVSNNTAFIIPNRYTVAGAHFMHRNKLPSTNMLNTSSTGMPPANKNLQGGHISQVSNNVSKNVAMFSLIDKPLPPESNNVATEALSTGKNVKLDKAQVIDGPRESLTPTMNVAELSKTTSNSSPVSVSTKLSGHSPFNNRKLMEHNAKFVAKPYANKKLKNQQASKVITFSSGILLKNTEKTTEADLSAKNKPGLKSLEGKQNIKNGNSAANTVNNLVECPKNTRRTPGFYLITTSKNDSILMKKIDNAHGNALNIPSTSIQPVDENLPSGQTLQVSNNLSQEVLIPSSVSQPFPPLPAKTLITAESNRLVNTSFSDTCIQAANNIPLTNDEKLPGGHSLHVSNDVSKKIGTFSLMDQPLPPESISGAITALSTSESMEPDTALEIDGPDRSHTPRFKEKPSDNTMMSKAIAELAKTDSSSAPFSMSTELSTQSPSSNNGKLSKHNTTFVTKPLAKLPKSKVKQPISKLQSIRSKHQLVSKSIKCLSKNTQTMRPPSDTNEIQALIKKTLNGNVFTKKFVTRYEMLSQLRQLKSEFRTLALSMKKELQTSKIRDRNSLSTTVATQTVVTFYQTESIQQYRNTFDDIPEQIPVIEHHPNQSDPHDNDKIKEKTVIVPAGSPEADSEKGGNDPHTVKIFTLASPPAVTLQNLNSNTSNNQLPGIGSEDWKLKKCPIITPTTAPHTQNIDRSFIPISTPSDKNQVSMWKRRNENELNDTHTTKKYLAEFDMIEMPSTSKVATHSKKCHKRLFPVEESKGEGDTQLCSSEIYRSGCSYSKRPSKVSGIPYSDNEARSKCQKMDPQYVDPDADCLFTAAARRPYYGHDVNTEGCNDRSSRKTSNSRTPCANELDVNTKKVKTQKDLHFTRAFI